MSNKKEIIFSYLAKYKEIGHAPLARLIYENHKDVFKNAEQIRGSIRLYRGKMKGKIVRENKFYEKVQRTSANNNANTTTEQPREIKRLFFDIETSPMIAYTWRIGYKLNLGYHNVIEDWKIICVSYKWEHESEVKTLTWDKNKCDKQLLIDFIKVMNEADESIAHNGDKFDIKKIRTRCLFHRVDAFPKYKTLDTLKKAKTGFNFPNNRLDTIAQWLGVGSKLKHRGFDMWLDVMKGCKKSLQEMVDYCEVDVEVLEEVYHTIQPYIEHNNHLAVLEGGEKSDCPNCASENTALEKDIVTKVGTIKRLMTCTDCKTNFELSNRVFLNSLKIK